MHAPRDEARGFGQFQPAREDVRRDCFVALKELLEAGTAHHFEITRRAGRQSIRS